jgi:hypothetical protein
MTDQVKALLQKHIACVRTRQWKRLAYKLTRDSGTSFTTEEAMEIGKAFLGPQKPPEVQVSVESPKTGGQVISVTGRGTPIKTLEDLLEVARVDLSVWSVSHWTANTWTNNGKENWQVKAHLVRNINPEDVLGALENVPTPYHQSPVEDFGDLLVIPDCQIGLFWSGADLHPYHDRKAMDTIWRVCKHQQPGTIVIVGDFLDLAVWSTKFQREPKDRYTTKHALAEARWWLTRLRRENPEARIVFLEGNHERRIQTVLVEYFQELSTLEMVDVPKLLGVSELGIEYMGPYGREATYFFGDRLMGHHGGIVRQGGGASTAAEIKGRTTSVFFGHTHRLGFSSRTTHTPNGVRVVTAMEVGCACRLDGVVPGEGSPDWAHGYGWASCTPEGVFQVPMLIMDGCTRAPDGHHIRGEDCGRQISEDLQDSRIR